MPNSDIVNGVSIGDAGDSTSSARTLTGSSTITGSAGGTDTDDYYKFTASASGTASFGLTGLSADLDLRLLNSSGTELVHSALSSNASESLSYGVVQGQTYYVYVDPFGTASSNYNLNGTLPATALPTLSVAASMAEKNEGNSGTTAFTFLVTRSSNTGTSSVNWDVGFIPTNRTDFSGDISGTLSFTEGQSTKLITVYVNGDTTVEGNESFNILLSNATGATIATSSASGLIINDDTASLNADIVNGTNITDAGNSTSSARTLTGSSTITGSAGGTDTDDYYKFTASSSGTASFGLTGLSADLDLRLLNSSGTELVHSAESATTSESLSYGVVQGQTYYVHVDPFGTASSNYNLSVTLPATALPTLSVAASMAEKNEGNSGTTAFTFLVTRSSGTGTSSVNWNVGHSSTNATDFSGATSGTVSFTEGQSTKLITVYVNGDTTVEGNESFNILLSNATGATIATSSAAGLIINDDTASLNADIVNGTSITDAGNSTASARTLTSSSTITGSAGGTDTDDYYKFTASSSGTASFGLTGLSADLDLRLLNSSGTELVHSAESATTSESLSYGVVQGQTYYVHVDPFGTASSNYNLSVTLPARSPEVKVVGNGVEIVDGDTTPSSTDATSFGTAGQNGTGISRTFTVQNTGTSALTTANLTAPTGFTITEGLSSSIAAGGSDTFTVRMDTATAGSKSGQISFTSNDGNEGVYNFAVSGTVNTPTDDHGATSTTAGSLSEGYMTLGHIETSGDVDWYAISLTAGRTYTVNLEGAPTGKGTLSDPYLGGIYSSSNTSTPISGTINDDNGSNYNSRVVYTPSSSGTYYIAAQAVNSNTGSYRLSVTSTAASGPEVKVLGSGVEIIDGDTTPSSSDFTSFGTVNQNGTAISRTFTVQNTGTSALTTTSLTAPTGFTITEGLSSSIAAGRSDTFTVRMDTATAGSKSGQISFTSNDSNEGVYNFAVSGTVNTLTDDYGATPTTAGTISDGFMKTGHIETAGDVDWYAISLTAGRAYTINLEGAPTNKGTLSDPSLRGIYSASNTSVPIAGTINDDNDTNANSRVVYTPSSSGTYYISAGAYSTYTGSYRLSVTSTIASGPEVKVQGNGVEIVDGDTTPSSTDATSFGTAGQNGTGISRTFTVQNTGTSALTTANLTAPTGFTIIEGLSSSISAGGSDTFTVRMDTATTGSKSGQISFTSNDSNEGTYNFAVGGTVNMLTDDYGTTPITAGTISDGFMKTGHIETAGDVDWYAISLTAGRAYTINLEGAPTGKGTLSDPYLGGIYSASNTNTPISGTINDDNGSNYNSRVVYTPSSSGTYYIAAQAVNSNTGSYRLSVTSTGALAPEVKVVGNGVEIVDGDTTPSSTDATSFGTASQNGTGISRTFTVQNTGTSALTTANLTAPTGFTIIEGLSSSISAGGSDTFTVRMDTATAGSKSGQISFTSNDSNEGKYNFAVNGIVRTADEAGNSTGTAKDIGALTANLKSFKGWVGATDANDYYKFTLDSMRNLTVQLTGLSGDADVYVYGSDGATFLEGGANSGNANEKVQLNNLAAGTYYARVFPGITGVNTNYTLSLSARATTAVTAPEIKVMGNGVNILDGDTSPSTSDYTLFSDAIQKGTPSARTFTVQNTGPGALTISNFRLPTGFSLVEGLSSSIAAGAQDTFTVAMNTTSAGAKNGQISFTTNDVDEHYYNYSIGGYVNLQDQVLGPKARILSTTPSDESDNISAGSNLVISFDRGVKAGIGYVNITNLYSNYTRKLSVQDKQVSFSGNTMTINLIDDLSAGYKHEVSFVSGVVRDLNNKSADGLPSGSLNFTTQRRTGLTTDQQTTITDFKRRYTNGTAGSFNYLATRTSDYDSILTRIISNGEIGGQCAGYDSYLRPSHQGLGNAYERNDKALNKGFHVDTIPIVGSSIVFEKGVMGSDKTWGHTGVVTEVDIRKGYDGYSYSITTNESNTDGKEHVFTKTRSMSFPKQTGISYIWGTTAEYTEAQKSIVYTIHDLYASKLIEQASGNILERYTNKTMNADDNKLINRFFLLNDTTTFNNFINLIELYNVEIGKAPTVAQLAGRNLTNDVLAGAIVGTSAANTLVGTDDSNTLIGGAGNDVLTGGGGNDYFKFVSPFGGIDTITDFNSGHDRIEIVAEYFNSGLDTIHQFAYGELKEDRLLRTNSDVYTETTDKALFVFNTTTGALYFDRDGKNDGCAVQIATLNNKDVKNTDIFIVSA